MQLFKNNIEVSFSLFLYIHIYYLYLHINSIMNEIINKKNNLLN